MTTFVRREDLKRIWVKHDAACESCGNQVPKGHHGWFNTETKRVRHATCNFDVDDTPMVTASGKVLTDEDIQALADEAERGYDVSHLKAGR